MSDAKMSALIVAGLICVGLTLMLNEALRNLIPALEISIPVSLIVGAIMFVIASDGHKKSGGDQSPKDK